MQGDAPAVAARTFLFLQGPISTFFDRLGRALIARGHRVHRINLHFGDRLFWRLPAMNYRGRFEDWRAFIADALERHRVTHLVLHGEQRPYHIVAAEEARARGITVLSTDLGYVRPDWVTLEADGMTSYSRFPRDPATIRALAERFPPPDLEPRFHAPFRLVAAWDVVYNLGLVFGRPLYPNYRYHGIYHPFLEYAGWLGSRAKLLLTRRRIVAEKQRLQHAPGSYFLFPLQLATDFQLRAHSPFAAPKEMLRRVIASFAANGIGRDLVCIVHPLDPGITAWRRMAARLARECGVADRVRVLAGGTPDGLLRNAAGIVTVNSTIGITALHHGVPVKALGSAVFDVPGLTCQTSLDAFWRDPPRPDPALTTAFARALCGATQVKGGYYDRASQASAVVGFVERLERGVHRLPPLAAAELARRAPRPPRRHVALSGVSDAIGLALARAYAAPGVRLSLIGTEADRLADAVEDCRRRGAVVDCVRLGKAGEAGLRDSLAELDRRMPVDLLLLHADAAEIGRIGSENERARSPEAEVPAAMNAVAALLEPMRERRHGRIMLVSSLIGHALPRDLPVLNAGRRALLAYGEALRFRLRGHGVSVTTVVPGDFALRAAARCRQPSLAAISPDRVAARILRGARMGRPIVAIPCRAAVALRMLHLAPRMLRDWLCDRRARPGGRVVEPIDETALRGGSAAGD